MRFPPNEKIIQSLLDHYGIQVTTLTLLPLGADINARVYRGNQDYFIKIKAHYDQGKSETITHLLSKNGIENVLLPIRDKQGRSSLPIDGYTLIVYPFIVGEDGFTRDLTNNQWMLLGKTLKSIHEIVVPPSIQIRKETYSPKWREAVKSLLTKGGKHKLIDFIKKNSEAIFRLVLQAEQLIPDPAPFVLCHADIHGGNVLIDEKNQIFIIDWDDPILAPKERDLMFIGGGVGNVWNKPHEEIYFYKGYGEAKINRTILAYYRHERILEDIAIYYEEILSPSLSESAKEQMYQHFIAMFVPNGVVDMAFRSANL